MGIFSSNIRRALWPLLGFIAILASPSHAQSLFWKISGKNLKKPSWLYGTMHMGDKRITEFKPGVLEALNQSKTLALELELDKVNPFEALQLMVMDSLSLSDLFSAADYELLEGYFRDSLNQSLSLYKNLKPIFLYSMMMEIQMQKQAGEGFDLKEGGVDMTFLKQARQAEKNVVGLETLSEQMSALDSWPLEEQARYLIQSLKEESHPESQYSLARLTELYIAGDLDGMMALSEQYPSSPEFERNLIEKRNALMTERMIPLFKKGPAFIAVGALHLPGENGIISQLRAAGYVVEPVME